MDLGFSRTLRIPADDVLSADDAHAVELDVLLAAAAVRQAASPTAHEMASVLRGQEAEGDMVQALAAMFAPRVGGTIETACLSGSFNPLAAGHSTVGKDDEQVFYLGDLADVQGSGR